MADWVRLFPDSAGGADGERVLAVGQDLMARWSEPHRRYHTLEHLAFLLRVIDAHAGLADDADAVRLAAWFHDAVYEVFAADNEERSALLAGTILGSLGISDERTQEVARLVRLTAGHAVAAGDRNGALLADADLAILASDAAVYDRYAAAVRAEYAAVPDDAFRTGRAAILRKLMDLPDMFRVVPDRIEWSARARANLAAEVTRLSGAP